MNQNRKDQDTPNRQKNTEKAEGSRESPRESVLDDRDAFEHGSGDAEIPRRMSSKRERDQRSTARDSENDTTTPPEHGRK